MDDGKLYVLLSAPSHSSNGRLLVIKTSFDRDDLERTKAAIEAQAGIWAPKLEVAPLDERIAKWYWPKWR